MRHFALILPMVLMSATSFADDPKPSVAKVEPKPADGDAPLAEGFPKATKPGDVEVKTYPAYRSAVAKIDKATTASGDVMFFALFNHIQKNNVEMTAPVINTYKTPQMIETPGTKGEITMEFVYRNTLLGKTGKDGVMVDVVDHPSQEFVCLGLQGGMSDAQMREAVASLKKWLDEHKTEWEEDGSPRRLGYHGPMTPVAQRLWEVQIPVKAVKAK